MLLEIILASAFLVFTNGQSSRFRCRVTQGIEPNLSDTSCATFYRCANSTGRLRRCRSGQQFHFRDRVCKADADVWCNVQRRNYRRIQPRLNNTLTEITTVPPQIPDPVEETAPDNATTLASPASPTPAAGVYEKDDSTSVVAVNEPDNSTSAVAVNEPDISTSVVAVNELHNSNSAVAVNEKDNLTSTAVVNEDDAAVNPESSGLPYSVLFPQPNVISKITDLFPGQVGLQDNVPHSSDPAMETPGQSANESLKEHATLPANTQQTIIKPISTEVRLNPTAHNVSYSPKATTYSGNIPRWPTLGKGPFSIGPNYLYGQGPVPKRTSDTGNWNNIPNGPTFGKGPLNIGPIQQVHI